MERIEVPAEIYFKASDGKKFYSETECHRYEFLSDKYMNKERHAVCEDGEGHLHNFFFACNIFFLSFFLVFCGLAIILFPYYFFLPAIGPVFLPRLVLALVFVL